MCGLAGCIGTKDVVTINRMLDALLHRGPDDRGLHAYGDTVFGHTRLSIVDVARGRQPILLKGGRSGIICNGEIYNAHTTGQWTAWRTSHRLLGFSNPALRRLPMYRYRMSSGLLELLIPKQWLGLKRTGLFENSQNRLNPTQFESLHEIHLPHSRILISPHSIR
jgi:hypothetical protein